MKKVKSKELNDVKKTGGKYAHFERTLLVKENEIILSKELQLLE